MLEIFRSALNRNVVAESICVPSQDVLTQYRRINQVVPDNIKRMIELYPNWRHEVLTPGEVGHLTWYFDKTNPSHISWRLTRGGKARRVEQVARAYLSLGPESLADEWEEVPKIEGMIASLKNGEKLPVLIIIRGSRYPDSPDSSFIDGVHRSLAIVIYDLTTQDSNPEVDTYVGWKASLTKRLIGRLTRG